METDGEGGCRPMNRRESAFIGGFYALMAHMNAVASPDEIHLFLRSVARLHGPEAMGPAVRISCGDRYHSSSIR